MGKNAKERKKRRLAAGLEPLASHLPSPPPSASPSVGEKRSRTEDDFEEGVEDPDAGLGLISQHDLAVTLRTLAALDKDPELLKSKAMKGLRAAVHQLHAHTSTGNSIVARISDALSDGRWTDSLVLLAEMRYRNQVPKLGTLQRWVRDCDAARGADGGSPETRQILKVLDSILRTADPSMVPKPEGATDDPVKMHEPWVGRERASGDIEIKTAPDVVQHYKSKFKVVFNEPGPARRPPNRYDATLHLSSPNTIDLSAPTTVHRITHPTIPGCFMLQDVLTPSECSQILTAAESIGFTPDEPIGGSAADQKSILAHNVFWLADQTILDPLLERVKPFLPTEIGGGALAGITARWRVYRYLPGLEYRPHIDGAWPQSGIDETGKYVYDLYGDRRSRLTFLVYLNDDFEGGGTTFFLPSATEGVMDGRVVTPRAGCILCFPHGDAAGSLLHEGSAVTKGKKYIIRADVLYMLPPGAK
ncbi:hypothetical protein HK097_000874 [Rhizophlyctis rosea]|uniref:Fe2OG dioxygenase domain-containing protein n=1 Tax=Rhizophlyctis rosea TaxID=64517 RepID=A0AAD5WZ83_9FUNG|nr:hypothetical protein HK097_000874 [Rhizophlyctis rosea]